MKRRCLDPAYYAYRNYGGRGITVCERWMDFQNFYEDMGSPPFKNAHIDRINNNLGSSPANCRWASPSENCKNRRDTILLSHNDDIVCASDLAKKYNIKPTTFIGRLKRGWSVSRAILEPVSHKFAHGI